MNQGFLPCTVPYYRAEILTIFRSYFGRIDDFINSIRGVTGYLKLGGQVVMQRAAAARRRLLLCQKLGGQLPTLKDQVGLRLFAESLVLLTHLHFTDFLEID